MSKLGFSRIKTAIKNFTSLTEEQIESFFSRKTLRRDRSEIAVFLMIAIYTVVLSYFTILKHSVFRSYAWDLGINNQVLWTTLNEGRLFYYTPELYFNPSGNFFGLHLSPIMFLILPVYAIYQAPETLLVFQSFILALAVVPLYFLCKNYLSSRMFGVAFSAVYLLNSVVHGVNWFDFHVQAFLPLFFFAALYYFKKEKWTGYFMFTILALMVAENVVYVVLFMGFYALWTYRKMFFSAFKQRSIRDRRVFIPLTTIVLAVFWMAFSTWIQNTFFPLNSTFSRLYRAVDYYSVLGVQGDPKMIPFYAIFNPLKTVEALTFDAYFKLAFLALLFGPLLFLPLRSGIAFVTLAWLAPALLSNYQPYYMIGDHYPAYVIPFIFVAAVDALKKNQVKTANSIKLGGYAKNLLVLAVMFTVLASPLSPLLATTNVSTPFFSQYTLPVSTEHMAVLGNIVRFVPSNASIITQNNIFPHVSGRINAYVFPLPYAVDFAPEEMNIYVDQLLDRSDYVLLDFKTDTYEANRLFFGARNLSDFGLLLSIDGILLFKRGYTGHLFTEVPA